MATARYRRTQLFFAPMRRWRYDQLEHTGAVSKLSEVDQKEVFGS